MVLLTVCSGSVFSNTHLFFAQVREEQMQFRGDDLDAPITGEMINEMKYTRQCVKEILRYRPSAPMVPQMAQKPFKMTEDYTAPAGTMIIPSLWSACMQVSTWLCHAST
jgi:cytochrome P450